MSELFLYAVASGKMGRLSIKGVAGERLSVVQVGRLSAVVGRVQTRPSPTERSLRRYDRTIRELWDEASALLPVRFGTSAHDVADLSAMIRSQTRDLQSRLRATRGRAQMTVRMMEGKATEASGFRARKAHGRAPSGTAFLKARAGEERRAREVPEFARLRVAVERFVREERLEKRGGVASIYHLVPRGSVERYRAAIEGAARRANIRLMVSGPWPPYAFASSE